jgi:hypothetical protein
VSLGGQGAASIKLNISERDKAATKPNTSKQIVAFRETLSEVVERWRAQRPSRGGYEAYLARQANLRAIDCSGGVTADKARTSRSFDHKTGARLRMKGGADIGTSGRVKRLRPPRTRRSSNSRPYSITCTASSTSCTLTSGSYRAVPCRGAAAHIEARLAPRKNSRARCSRCDQPGATYDHQPERRLNFVSLWGLLVYLLYVPRRVDCGTCGVHVEAMPWATGKSSMTTVYMIFLATWARRLSWAETARVFASTWGQRLPGCRVGRRVRACASRSQRHRRDRASTKFSTARATSTSRSSTRSTEAEPPSVAPIGCPSPLSRSARDRHAVCAGSTSRVTEVHDGGIRSPTLHVDPPGCCRCLQ